MCVGGGGGGGGDERLALQRSVKASKGSTLGQTTGGFFSLCSLSNYMVDDRNIRRGKGVIPDR